MEQITRSQFLAIPKAYRGVYSDVQGVHPEWKGRRTAFLPGHGIAGADETVDLAAQGFQHGRHTGGVIFKRNDFELEGLLSVVGLCPEVDQSFAGAQNRGADADHEPLHSGDMARPLDGGVRGGDDLFGILVNGTPCFGQLYPVVGAFKQFDADSFFQGIDLIHHGNRRDIQSLGGL